MSIPIRNADRSQVLASERTFFITSSIWGKRSLLQSDRVARLLIEVFYHYREQGKYLLHEFVVMPDHFHVICPLPSWGCLYLLALASLGPSVKHVLITLCKGCHETEQLKPCPDTTPHFYEPHFYEPHIRGSAFRAAC